MTRAGEKRIIQLLELILVELERLREEYRANEMYPRQVVKTPEHRL